MSNSEVGIAKAAQIIGCAESSLRRVGIAHGWLTMGTRGGVQKHKLPVPLVEQVRETFQTTGYLVPPNRLPRRSRPMAA